MRLRFSIRDLFWLTLVVAMGLAWFVRERQLSTELNDARNRAGKWRGVTGALESVLRGEEWELEWYPEWSGVHLFAPDNLPGSRQYYIGAFEGYQTTAPY